MTADTAIAEPDVDTLRRFPTVEEMTLAHHEAWAYLVRDLPVRPPTDEEAAGYAARRDDPAWADLYAYKEPHIILPPGPEVTALLDPAPADPEPEPEPLPAPVLDEKAEGALARFHQAHDEMPAEEDLAADPKHELHHEKHDTQILYVPRDEPA